MPDCHQGGVTTSCCHPTSPVICWRLLTLFRLFLLPRVNVVNSWSCEKVFLDVYRNLNAVSAPFYDVWDGVTVAVASVCKLIDSILQMQIDLRCDCVCDWCEPHGYGKLRQTLYPLLLLFLLSPAYLLHLVTYINPVSCHEAIVSS